MSDDTRNEDAADPNMDVVVGNPDEGTLEFHPIDMGSVKMIQFDIVELLRKNVFPREPLYIEILIALGNVICAVSMDYLAGSEHPRAFQLNRDQVLRVLGESGAFINGLALAPDVLANAETDGKVH